jgi:hypothetical protein
MHAITRNKTHEVILSLLRGGGGLRRRRGRGQRSGKRRRSRAGRRLSLPRSVGGKVKLET